MFKIPPKARRALRVLAVAMSTGLFGYLIWRTGPSKLWENVMTLGWGFTWVIALAGVSHLAKTWAWRCHPDRIPTVDAIGGAQALACAFRQRAHYPPRSLS